MLSCSCLRVGLVVLTHDAAGAGAGVCCCTADDVVELAMLLVPLVVCLCAASYRCCSQRQRAPHVRGHHLCPPPPTHTHTHAGRSRYSSSSATCAAVLLCNTCSQRRRRVCVGECVSWSPETEKAKHRTAACGVERLRACFRA